MSRGWGQAAMIGADVDGLAAGAYGPVDGHCPACHPDGRFTATTIFGPQVPRAAPTCRPT